MTDQLVVTLAAEGKFLVSFWKPLILLVPFVAWAWIISRVYDKHAARFYLGREKWNVAHMCAGLAAFAAAVLIPMQGEAAFWIGLAVMLLILGADILIYPLVVNKDERVPEAHRIRFDALTKVAEARQARAAAKQTAKVELKIMAASDKSLLAPPQVDTPDFEVRTTAEGFVLRALGNRASQLDIGPVAKDGGYGVSFLIDGIRQTAPETLSPALAVKVIDLWKGAAKLDVNDRRRKLTGDVLVERGEAKTRLRVQSMGTQAGQRLTILMDPERQVRRKFDQLGLLDAQRSTLEAIVNEPGGVVLLAGGPDQGRTTTFYSVLKMHDAYTSNIQTAELEPQDFLEGVRQNQFEHGGEGPEFATFLRSILRRDPQVVGVSDLVDEQTAREVARADLDRTRIYVSIRAESGLAALQAYMKAVGDMEQASKGLRAVVSQKLIRRLCENCRVPYTPSGEMLKTLGLPAGKISQLFKKGGQVLIKNKPDVCPVCQGVGYFGLEGAFEVLPIDKDIRELLKTGNLSAVQAEWRKRQLPSVRQAALAKVVAGVTSVEEFGRVTAEAKPAGGGPKPAAPKPAAAGVGESTKPPGAKA